MRTIEGRRIGRAELQRKEGGSWGTDTEVFVALDVAKLKNAVALAAAGRSGEVWYLGEIENTFEATRRLIAKLSAKYARLSFCYEAGPTG